MAEFSMFSNEMLQDALKSKNKGSIINLVIQTIIFDKTFSNGEFDRLIDIIKHDYYDVFEAKHTVDGELSLPVEKWNDDYFNDLLFNLRSNFCIERIEEIENAGKVIYKRQNNVKECNENPIIPQLSQKRPDAITPSQMNQMKTGKMKFNTKALAFASFGILIIVLIAVIFLKNN